jgi:hypothetical protein
MLQHWVEIMVKIEGRTSMIAAADGKALTGCCIYFTLAQPNHP